MPEVKGFRYAYSAKQIEEVFHKIQETGRPDKLTITYIQETWLLKNAQYSSVLDILKGMQFIDGSSQPTELYGEYQNKELAKGAMAKGLIMCYPNLFKAYPKAHTMGKAKLEGYFKQQTGADKSVVDKVWPTFNKLCSLADFDSVSAGTPTNGGGEQRKPLETPRVESGIPITMNIQIAIPNDATAEQYDKIFTSIKKNLMS